MRILWAVTVREVRERWQLVGLAAFLMVMLPAMSWLPLGFNVEPAAVRQVLCFGAGVGYFLLCSLLLGLSLFASDQASGRVGFYSSRPISPWQLLCGRLAAALALVLSGSLLIVLPTFAGIQRGRPGELLGPLVVVVVTCILLLAVGHLFAVAIRLRGAWTLLDLAAALMAAFLFSRSRELALEELLFDVVRLSPYMVAAIVPIVFLLSLWVQLRRGGTQRGRLHSTFSITFWIGLVGALLAFHGWLLGTAGKDWQDARGFEWLVASNDGSALWVVADLNGLSPRPFVVDLVHDRVIPVDPKTTPWTVEFSGRQMVGWSCREVPGSRGVAPGRCRLGTLDLDAAEPVWVETGLTWDGAGIRPLWSDDGRYLARADDEEVDLFEFPSARRLQRFELGGVIDSLAFTGPDRLVAASEVRSGETRLFRLSFDGSVEELTVRGRLLEIDPSHRALVVSRDDEIVSLDLETLEVQERPGLRRSTAFRTLSNGFRAFVGDEILRQDREGQELVPVSLPRPRSRTGRPYDTPNLRRSIGPELEPGRVLVSLGVGGYVQSGWDLPWPLPTRSIGPNWIQTDQHHWTHYVDVTRGEVVATFDGFRPLRRTFPARRDDGDGSVVAWLLDERGLPHRFDPATWRPGQRLEPVFEPPWQETDREDTDREDTDREETVREDTAP